MDVFEDTDFPPGPESIGGGKHINATWRRVQDLRGVKDPPVLFGRIEADAVEQGELGDCWLLAAFAAVADFPGHLKSLFDPREYAPDGRYSVRLYDIGKGWQTIVIDDRIPCLPHSGGCIPCFCQVQENGFWALLLEKAFAKFCGSYYHLDGGGASWAFQALTGIADQLSYHVDKERGVWKQWKVNLQSSRADPETWRTEGMKSVSLISRSPVTTFTPEAFFGQLAYLEQCNCLLSASISGDEVEGRREDGLIECHAYSITAIQMADGHCMVKLRNPWGGSEWNGPFSDKSEEWSLYPELADDLRMTAEEDGEFWMPWSNFASIFTHVKVSPGNLRTPKQSLVGGKSGTGIRCDHCHNVMARIWCQSDFVPGAEGSWSKLGDGDLCFMCRRAQVGEREFSTTVSGIDYFPRFPRLAMPEPPRSLPTCKYGTKCYRYNPDHFAQYSHPWLGMNFDGKPLDTGATCVDAVSYTDAEAHAMLNCTKNGDWEGCIELIKAKPALVDARPSVRNWAAIHRAAASNAVEVLRVLIDELAADPDLLTGDGNTPLQLAVKGGPDCQEAAVFLQSKSKFGSVRAKTQCVIAKEVFRDGSERPILADLEECDDECEEGDI